jgi:hypothetical protein
VNHSVTHFLVPQGCRADSGAIVCLAATSFMLWPSFKIAIALSSVFLISAQLSKYVLLGGKSYCIIIMGSSVHQSVTQHLVFSHYVHILYFLALYNGIACSNPGSITCMAPGLLRAEDSRRTAASDIYACACVCLEVRQSLTITLNRLIFDALLHLGIYWISIYMFQAMLQWF